MAKPTLSGRFPGANRRDTCRYVAVLLVRQPAGHVRLHPAATKLRRADELDENIRHLEEAPQNPGHGFSSLPSTTRPGNPLGNRAGTFRAGSAD
jgi:hypothetical protein